MNQQNEFDPSIDPNSPEATDPVVAAQLKEQRRGDEFEAQGLNRDGSPKVQPTQPTQPAPAAPVAERTLDSKDFGVIRDHKIQDVVDAPNAGANLTEEALRVKLMLAKQPKLPFFIPLDPGEKKGAYRSVTINGYRCEVKKGVMVNVPESIYKLLVKSYADEADATSTHENNLENAENSGERKRALGLA